MITIPVNIENEIPGSIIRSLAAMIGGQQQIFAYKLLQNIAWSKTHELIADIAEIAITTFSELLDPQSPTFEFTTFEQFQLHSINEEISKLIFNLHGFFPPFPVANNVTEAEYLKNQLIEKADRRSDEEFHSLLQQCATFEGREELRAQMEEWEMNSLTFCPIPEGFDIPAETNPDLLNESKSRSIQRRISKEIQEEHNAHYRKEYELLLA